MITRPKATHRSGWLRFGILILGFLGVWLFATIIGPALQHKIPFMDQIVQTAEESDIDMGAYFYTEIEASYDGERYLGETLQFYNPRGAGGFTWSFASAVLICLGLLALGFRYLPND